MSDARSTTGFSNPRRGSARTAGLLAAAGVAVLGAGAVGYFIWKAPPKVQPSNSLQPSMTVPDIKTLPNGSGTGVVSRLGSNTGPFMQIADRNDPSRVAGELSAERSELLPDKRYLLVKPRAWNFLRDGRALFIEADSGRAYIPDESPDGRPEEALLEGNVVIRLFAKAAKGERPDPERDTPLYTARTNSLAFDGTLGQITTPGELKIDGEDGSFKGRGLTLLVNEVSERIEYLKVEKTDYIQVRAKPEKGESTEKPKAIAQATPGQTAPTTPAPTPIPKPAVAVLEPGRQTDYLATCDGNVSIVQGTRSITGNSLSAWVRSTQSAKPIAAKPLQAGPSSWLLGMMQPGVQPEAEAKTEIAVVDDPESDEPVVMTFDGVLQLRPLGAAPIELTHNEAFVRITSRDEGGVVASDTSTGSTATAILAEYGVTKRDVAFGSNEPMGVLLSAPGSGSAAAQRIELSLANGRAHVRGAGSLSDDSSAESARSVTWSESADFRFAMDNGRMTARLAEAFLSGTVRAADQESEFNAARVQATFDPIGEKSRLARLFLAGRAWGFDGSGGQLSANTIDVHFAPDSPDSTTSSPASVMARGNVVAAQPDSALWAEGIDVSLGQIDGSLGATRAFATGPVFFQNADGVMAQADTLVAWPAVKRIELSGPDAAISKGTTLIAGPAICMDGDAKTLEMPGAGLFAHTLDEAGIVTQLDTAWAGSMRFDDSTGFLVCDGRTTATARKSVGVSEVQRDTMEASRLEIMLSSPNAGTPSTDSMMPNASGRAVTLVRAIGGGTGPAKVESRTYVAGGERVLQQLLYLESGIIEADNSAGELRVPGAGKLLAVDRRNSATTSPGSAMSDSMSDTTGNSLFAWSNSMSLQRSTGLARMLGSVKLVHDRQNGSERVMLECEQLEAKLAMDAAASPGDLTGSSGRLANAVATDRVWMRYDGRELTARVLAYDAETDIVTANGDGNLNPVSMLDLSKGTPFNAQSILWNLGTNRFEARQLSPIVMPR